MPAGALDRETLLEARRIRQRSSDAARGSVARDIRRYYRSRNKAKHRESR
jgi:hypothetical protein